ncbi:Ig-like domain-containing protein [Myxococcus sp. K15C18031901]|uniref:Ig-like domain-containing protein n=1 Tax=Myxococcus dinghuensis TaxID=2906761 RepID=UPI0020A7521D|nr:Ig-like domain-containing protein [Myxococcus dinghuensis]MCP3097306.1 Ig-like domain-containing protein [Myxococcus dinghuensis]
MNSGTSRALTSWVAVLVVVLGGCTQVGERESSTGTARRALTSSVTVSEAVTITSQGMTPNGAAYRNEPLIGVFQTEDYEIEALLRFPQLGVPVGAVVQGATLRLAMETYTDGFAIRGAYLQTPWNLMASELGWQFRDDGLEWERLGAVGQGTDLVANRSFTLTTFPDIVTIQDVVLDVAMVQSWVDDPSTNQGLMLANTQVGKVAKLFTALATQPERRPVLTLEYTAPGPRSDTTPPTVAITSPAANATVEDVVTVAVSASDDVGVASVQLRIDGRDLASSQLDTRLLRNGGHVLTAHARDAAGNLTTSAPVRITIDNEIIDTSPPQVQLTLPADGSTVSGPFVVRMSATDDVGVTRVHVELDGVQVGDADLAAPWSVALDTENLQPYGSRQLTAVARDAAGHVTTSTPITVVVSAPPPDTTPPQVQIVSPASGATVGGTLQIRVDAYDDVRLAGVRLRVDGQDFGQEDVTYPYWINVTTTRIGNGTFSVTAVARDRAGNLATSAPISLTIANGPPVVLDIPVSHPRIWFTGDRLARAQAYFALNPYTPATTVEGPEQALDAAMHSLITGSAASCRAAITWAVNTEIPITENTVSSDPARWYGEGIILTYDWCFAHLSPGERTTLLDRWNLVISALNDNPWGGIGMEGNNYYTGYFRNSLLWAIASWHENQPYADDLLQYAMNSRWDFSLKPYLDGAAAGGAPHEGSTYGRRTFGYMTVPFTTLGLYGHDMWNQTDYFMETVFWAIYSTAPGLSPMGQFPLYETFPFNDDERWLSRWDPSNTAQTTLGSYFAPLIEEWSDQPIAGYAKRFLEMTGHPIDDRMVRYVYSDTLAAVPSRDLSTLPLDYRAPGLNMVYAKTAWAADATMVNLQFGVTSNAGHAHRDSGNFQLWRAGQFLLRETVGYADYIVGYAGNGVVETESPVAHNTLLFEGLGTVGYYHHAPQMLRLESSAVANYAAVDLTGVYDVNDEWAHREAEVGNPYAGRVVRETLFVRPLDALVVFDRVESANDDASVDKTFIVHFPQSPVLTGNTWSATSGGQELRVSTLVPASPVRRVIDERGPARADGSHPYPVGQFRGEVETQGQVVSHFLHVVQARDVTTGSALTLTLAETSTTYTVTMSHPTRGSAVVQLEKGITSTGGSFGYAASGPVTLAPLRTTVQPMSVTGSGPVWGP